MKTTERELAYKLYMEQNMTLTEIAAKLNVHFNTVSKWAYNDNWKQIRSNKIITPGRLKATYIEQCVSIINNAKEQQRMLTEEEVDNITKFKMANKAIDTECHIGTYAYVLRQFNLYLLQFDPAYNKQYLNNAKQFIQHNVNTD